ncbi:MAG: energy-coupling factor transporter ATPase [Ruminococcaceae bacterium]|nr:energy-coupling factor transporter ATPase [Oscillospiraceae bacterium]MBR3595965.1 energy-coupling factor transporter ATPase [Clostridia bacterium]
MNEKVLIEFSNVSYTYDEESADAVYAVSDISFNVKKGEFIVILGHNGSGKSTVAKLSNAIFTPSSGKVFVDSMDTSDEKNEFLIREKVGVVFQNPDNQIVASIVEEDVAFGPENLGIDPDIIRKRVDEALKSVGMYEYRLHETHRLSGGQKQRVAIAGMIAMQPQCIFFDESTAMLDPQGRKEVMNTVRKLNKEFGVSIVFITHFMEEAVNADKVIVINEGRIFAEGTPAEIFSRQDMLENAGLDVPDTVKLASLLRENGIPLDGDILTEENFIKAYLKAVKHSA